MGFKDWGLGYRGLELRQNESKLYDNENSIAIQ